MGGGPSIPKPPPAPPPVSPVDPELADIRRRRRMAAKGLQGRLSTILTGPSGLVTRGTISMPTLLGGTGKM